MTNFSGDLHSSIGNHYGFRNWIEYGFKQAKNELGWADFRVTNYQQIEKWWEIVSCAFLLVSLQANQRNNQLAHESVGCISLWRMCQKRVKMKKLVK